VLGENRFPVDVKSLAMEVSRNQPDPITTIKDVDIPGFEGMLRAGRKKPGWHILYNRHDSYPSRERFTLAHEFGHYMLHRQPLAADFYRGGELANHFDFQCLPLQTNKWNKEEYSREEEADTFASYLLMPIDDYRIQVGGQKISRSLLAHITNRYGVSLLAAVRKWIEFTPARAVMVVARDGYALWGRASESAYRSGIFIPSGMPIPDNSVTGLGPALSEKSDHAVAVHAGVWEFSRGAEALRELAFFSERLDISISVLQFDEVVHDDVDASADELDTLDYIQRRED
jgi:hypothetical protein